MSALIKTLLVEDDRDFAFLLQKMIEKDERLEFTGHAEDKITGIEMAVKLKPDIVIMDLNLSGNELDGIETAKNIRLKTDAKILLLTSYEKHDVVINASKKAFASGYIFKNPKRRRSHDYRSKHEKQYIDVTKAHRNPVPSAKCLIFIYRCILIMCFHQLHLIPLFGFFTRIILF